MKWILTILFFVSAFSCTEKVVYERAGGGASTVSTPFGKALIADTTISGEWDGNWKVLRPIDAEGIVHMIHAGAGSKAKLTRWYIDAPLNAQIFDTSLILENVQPYGTYFSAAWFGAKVTNADNWGNLQKTINTCMDNNLYGYLPGGGDYKFSKRLDVSKMVNGRYQQCQLMFDGNASYWDASSHRGTTLQYTGIVDGPAINFQLNKGSKFNYIQLYGKWKSPGGSDSAYYNLTEANYKDQSGYNLSDNYVGIAFDYFFDGVSRSGSTGVRMDNLSVGGFATCISFSHNKITQNDDNMSITHVQFKDCKRGVETGQPQEKANVIDYIYSWGSCYNVVKHTGGGNYSFNHAGIAGRCIEPIQVVQGDWFSSNFSNWFCENIRDACTINSSKAINISDCNFDFNATISKKRIVLTSNSTKNWFTNCTFRYYDGTQSEYWMKGAATLINPDFYGGNVIWK